MLTAPFVSILLSCAVRSGYLCRSAVGWHSMARGVLERLRSAYVVLPATGFDRKPIPKREHRMTRFHARSLILVSLCLCATLLFRPTSGQGATVNGTMERWDVFEITLAGPTSGNPYLDVQVSATFRDRKSVV